MGPNQQYDPGKGSSGAVEYETTLHGTLEVQQEEVAAQCTAPLMPLPGCRDVERGRGT